MEEKEFDLELEYGKLKNKYELPEFEKLSEDFDLEKVSEKESLFLAREIRRAINEKMTAYLHLFETLINPAAPPMFVFSILRNISPENKELLKILYKKLARTQIETMKLDTIYNEEEEVKFIKETFENWQEIKKEVYQLIEQFESSFDTDDIAKRRSYFD
jgi:hypothetical protein